MNFALFVQPLFLITGMSSGDLIGLARESVPLDDATNNQYLSGSIKW